MEVTEKKKKTERKFLLKDIPDLKHYPLSLKDGDHIAICEINAEDDFQTEEDKVRQEQFNLRKAEEAR
jgi:hypothetical protein